MVSLRILATALVGFVSFAAAVDRVQPPPAKRTGIACTTWVENNIAMDDCPDGMVCFEPLGEGSDNLCVEE